MREDLHNKQMKLLLDSRTLTLIFIVCAIFARVVCSQEPVPTKISVTPEPVGSGARALGQSAFIAVADDATAASWNPAGLIQLEKPEASFVGAWRTVTKDYSVADSGLSIDQDRWGLSEINFMSYAQPIVLGNTDMVISVNYHQVYDFGVEYNGRVTITDPFPAEVKLKGKSEGAVSAYSLAGGLSMPSHPEITIGASFNWYAQSLLNDYAWQVKSTGSLWFVPGPPLPPSPLSAVDETETFDDFRAYNFTFGLLWDVYERKENLLTLGLVYHTPFTAKVDRESVINGVPSPPDRIDIDFPASLGAGANYRISDALSVAFDVEWKEWSEFTKNYADGTSKSPYDYDTVAYRLGVEHLTFFEGARESVLACRGGLFYEPRPVSDYSDPLKVYGLSAGLGWTVKDQFSLDFAYQFRWGGQDLGNFDYDYQEQLFVASLIIYF
jgi:long-chain fatty acid transport protein